MIPPKLKQGCEVRVISPARSLAIISEELREVADNNLRALGLKVSFSEHAEETGEEDNSSPIQSRVDDIHAAFRDKNVKVILTTIGGFNSNQLLRYLDYELIRANPKVFCGYSDITALQNAILTKTGLVTYYGPHYSTFGMKQGLDYTLESFKQCLFTENPFEVKASDEWSDNEWYLDQEKREFIKNAGHIVINEGQAEGKIIGGNLCTLNLLQGTEFMPDLTNAILFIEDDYESNIPTFDRDLQSLIHLPQFEKVKGIVIGRFQKKSKVTDEALVRLIKTKKELNDLPVIANVDFGHTTPHITFPIGGTTKLTATKDQAKLEIMQH